MTYTFQRNLENTTNIDPELFRSNKLCCYIREKTANLNFILFTLLTAACRAGTKIKEVQTEEKAHPSKVMSAKAEEIDVLKVKSVSREDSWSKYFQTFPIQHNQNFDIVPNFQPSTKRNEFFI